MMGEGVEYSAYIDDKGYVHALASNRREGESSLAPVSAIEKESGVSTVIHNHPHGGSDGRKWGEPLSEADLRNIAAKYRASGGKIYRMVATSREGIYTAVVTKNVKDYKVRLAAAKADNEIRSGRNKYSSELAMWKAVQAAYKKEFAKLGIKLSFSKEGSRKDRLVTQKIGDY